MAKPKTIYHVSVDRCGEYDFFFGAKGKILAYWHSNDANYRAEYMNPLFEALGYKVEEGEWDDPRWVNDLKEILLDCGATESDFE